MQTPGRSAKHMVCTDYFMDHYTEQENKIWSLITCNWNNVINHLLHCITSQHPSSIRRIPVKFTEFGQTSTEFKC